MAERGPATAEAAAVSGVREGETRAAWRDASASKCDEMRERAVEARWELRRGLHGTGSSSAGSRGAAATTRARRERQRRGSNRGGLACRGSRRAAAAAQACREQPQGAAAAATQPRGLAQSGGGGVGAAEAASPAGVLRRRGSERGRTGRRRRAAWGASTHSIGSGGSAAVRCTVPATVAAHGELQRPAHVSYGASE